MVRMCEISAGFFTAVNFSITFCLLRIQADFFLQKKQSIRLVFPLLKIVAARWLFIPFYLRSVQWPFWLWKLTKSNKYHKKTAKRIDPKVYGFLQQILTHKFAVSSHNLDFRLRVAFGSLLYVLRSLQKLKDLCARARAHVRRAPTISKRTVRKIPDSPSLELKL